MKRIIFAVVILSLLPGCSPQLVTPSYDLPTTVSEAERKACEESAQAQSAAVEGKSVAGLVVLGTLLASPISMVLSIGGQPFFLVPFMLFKEASDNARENSETRQRVYEEALKHCLEPTETPQQPPSAEHPNLVEALCTPEHINGECK